jgi:hypothetical protein
MECSGRRVLSRFMIASAILAPDPLLRPGDFGVVRASAKDRGRPRPGGLRGASPRAPSIRPLLIMLRGDVLKGSYFFGQEVPDISLQKFVSRVAKWRGTYDLHCDGSHGWEVSKP